MTLPGKIMTLPRQKMTLVWKKVTLVLARREKNDLGARSFFAQAKVIKEGQGQHPSPPPPEEEAANVGQKTTLKQVGVENLGLYYLTTI